MSYFPYVLGSGSVPGLLQVGSNLTVTGGVLSITSANVTASLGYTPLSAANNLSDVSSASTARTNLGLGSMATQSASAVAITGGTITGLSAGSNPGDAVNFSQFNAVAMGLQVKASANYATAAALPSNTYSNGASGVGATLTATANGALSVDGQTVSAGQIVLVKNEAAGANNGLYAVTNAGSGGAAYVLTRYGDMNTASQFSGAFVPVESGGTANGNSLWLANPTGAVTVGTTSIPFTQLNAATNYTSANGGITISGGVVTLNGATGATIGGVIVGSNITVSSGTISLTSGNVTAALSFTPLAPANNLSELASASTARTNLGLGSIATQAASSVAITGGTISGTNVTSPIRVVTASGAVTVATADNGGVIVVNKTTGAATTVNLPSSPATGFSVSIKDGKGDAATNNITITPASGTIDGASTAVVNFAYGSLEVIYNGTQWNIV